MNIVIIEDEVVMSMFLEESLTDLGHKVLGCFTKADNLFHFLDNNKNNIDLILMDILIYGSIDGIQAAIQIKEKYKEISIIFITSYKDSETINEAKKASPDGYIIKPITKNDLEAIMMVVNKENTLIEKKQTTKIKVSTYLFDTQTSLIYEKDRLIKLSKKEQICLSLLVKNKNNYVSHENFIVNIWQGEENNSSNSLRELIFRLRKKLPNLILDSTPNIGYILTNENFSNS